MQQSQIYRYFRIDADHDISAGTLGLSTDRSAGPDDWVNAEYVPPDEWPPRVAAVTSEYPPTTGMTPHWWRIMTGPGQPLPLPTGLVTVYGQLFAGPETPRVAWSVNVRQSD